MTCSDTAYRHRTDNRAQHAHGTLAPAGRGNKVTFYCLFVTVRGFLIVGCVTVYFSLRFILVLTRFNKVMSFMGMVLLYAIYGFVKCIIIDFFIWCLLMQFLRWAENKLINSSVGFTLHYCPAWVATIWFIMTSQWLTVDLTTHHDISVTHSLNIKVLQTF